MIIPIVCHKERADINTKLSGSQRKQTDAGTDPLMDRQRTRDISTKHKQGRNTYIFVVHADIQIYYNARALIA